ncbi:HNH endonuclease [Picosynechococcus sp. PCC 11901]
MDGQRKLYLNKNWMLFAEKVKHRDKWKCLQCARGGDHVILQVHHDIYIPGKAPWEYALSDCRTLCKGCHAREHGLIEPNRGWTLISIDDLDGLDGTCQRKGCNAPIRYEHLIYHPQWGYMVVGSTCIEYLTQEDRLLSGNLIKQYQNISKFVHKSNWSTDFTKQGKPYIYSKYQHHIIRIYGKEGQHSFQLALKKKGVKWYDFGNVIQLPRKSTLLVKELAYITLKGTISDNEEEKELLRNLYRELRAYS